MAQYLIGTGGWGHYNIGNKQPLKAYSELFGFVEVNYTFYEYPTARLVEQWRLLVPKEFVFSVRCHQDLTHKIGLKPTDEAFDVFYNMKAYCKILDAPYLVLETSANQVFDKMEVKAAREFFSSISTDNLRLVWEYRAPFTPEISRLMQDFNIVQSVDLSRQKPTLESEVVYSRVFGKGKHNLYQFTDQEIVEIEQNAQSPQVKKIAVSFHGARMYNDAARAQIHFRTGKFVPATNFLGVDSAKSVLSEDTHFPTSKAQLVADQGWKIIDLTVECRVHLADVLGRIPEKTYRSIADVVRELEAVI